jgi:hypothetical protein
MTLFYRRTNRLLEMSMEGILDFSSTGWRWSKYDLFIGEPTGGWGGVW